jgi:hypothetical protein
VTAAAPCRVLQQKQLIGFWLGEEECPALLDFFFAIFCSN